VVLLYDAICNDIKPDPDLDALHINTWRFGVYWRCFQVLCKISNHKVLWPCSFHVVNTMDHGIINFA